MKSSPVIVLVHGALTDASVWNLVSIYLQKAGYSIVAPAMPLRGLQSDAAYLSAFLDTINAPIVLVGHSYGGSIISHPGVARKNLEALVFVAAFAQDAGETTGELNGRWPGSKLTEDNVIVRPYPGGQDLYLKPNRFAEVYAGDLSAEQVAVLAAAQRPINPGALGESFVDSPTWRSVPAWFLISLEDNSLPAEAQKAMAKRAEAITAEVRASHASPLSQPEAVAKLIIGAARKRTES